MNSNSNIKIEETGRGGNIHFKSDDTSFSLWWEFAGNDAIAIIEAPGLEGWESKTGLPLAQREKVLNYIGEEVVAKKISSNGYFTIDENSMTIYAGKQPA